MTSTGGVLSIILHCSEMVSYSILLSVILMRVDQCTWQICVIDIERMLWGCHTKGSVSQSKIQKVHIYFVMCKEHF